MANSESSDGELLTDWLVTHREGSFRVLVERYAGLVQAAAFRISGDGTIATEASQLTFILLAKKARSLRARTSLAGWLHLTAVMQARNLMRKHWREIRKRERYGSAMSTDSSTDTGAQWEEWKPVIDAALISLPAKDREVVLLHFYRSLGVTEVAAVLGLEPDAARKRIRRAMEKLRGSLLRRGYQSTGALSLPLAVGLAADAKAACLPVAMISIKATTAAGCGASSVGSTLFAMKGMTVLPPVAALLIAGFWISTRRDAAARVEATNRMLATSIEGRKRAMAEPAAADGTTVGAVGFGNGKGGINWEVVAESFLLQKRVGVWGGMDSMNQIRLGFLLSRMSPAEQLAQLDAIDRLQIPPSIKEDLEQEIVLPLAWKDPALVLEHLASRLPGTWTMQHLLTTALRNVAKADPKKAAEWLDAQLATGRLESKRLDGINHARLSFEAVVIMKLLNNDPVAVAKRIEALPSPHLADLFGNLGNDAPKEAAGQDAYVKLIRTYLPEKEQLEALKVQATALAPDFGKAEEFLDRLDVPRSDRDDMVSAVGTRKIVNVACNRNVSKEDLYQLGVWLERMAPGGVDRTIGRGLAEASERGIKMGFTDALELARNYEGAAGGDEVLAALLDSDIARKNKTIAREAAENIRDEEMRNNILEKLK